ncbi:glycosyltransferase [Microbulbifer sp. ZKSA006]|uniref:glycosyltransferase n=1 Tax=Microbulbifer sp. ZKSA006 TaxID=3243390 RepID=UPI00403A0851
MKELYQDSTLGPSSRKKHICILTEDIFGPIKNGGIGTAYFHLAVFLQRSGHKVTICFINGLAKNPVKMKITKQFFLRLGINFFSVAPQALAKTTMARTMAIPYAAYEWLRQHEKKFDIVHVSEWRGTGYIALLAKSLGIAFGNIHFVVKGSSPTLWSAEGNQQFLKEDRQLGWVFMERKSAEMADTLICGSKYLIEWMDKNKYKLPERSFFWPNVFLDDLLPDKRIRINGSGLATREWVFFGRLEPRKGVILFVNALNSLAKKGVQLPTITFLGGDSYRFDAQKFIEENQENWQAEITFKNNFDAMEAIEYLRGEGRLAVIPALLENSPISVYECLATKIPFIAADTGGTRELLDPDTCEQVLFEPNHIALGKKLELHIKELPAPGVKHPRVKKSLEVWKRWHEQEHNTPQCKSPVDMQSPLITICITHFERPGLLYQALKSIEQQTYQNIEVIVVDDGSHSKEVHHALKILENHYANKGWQFIYQENCYVGAARNTAAKRAGGEYLLFFDDDNVMMPEMVEKMLRAAMFAGVDCLTCSSIRFSGEGEPNTPESKLGTQIRFMGPARAWATKVNIVGDATCLIKTTTFRNHGGYTERYRTGKDDIEFYSKLISANEKISYYPDALYYYRIGNNSMKARNLLQEEEDFRQISPYLHTLDAEEKSLLLLRTQQKGRGKQQGNKYKPGVVRRTMRRLRKFIRLDYGQ